MASFVEVVDPRGQVVVDMLSSDWKDYEDATQMPLQFGRRQIVL